MSESITIAECSKRMNKSQTFIRRAIINGSFPGSYTVSDSGAYSFHVPREAFEDYMKKFHRSVSDELVEALIEKYVQLNSKKQKAPAGDRD